jgi:hypothetical protein
MQRPTTTFIYLRTEIERNLKSEKKLGKLPAIRDAALFPWFVVDGYQSAGKRPWLRGRTHKERSTTTTFVDPLHKKAREKENAPTLY